MGRALQRMTVNEIFKKVMESKLEGKGNVGQPRLRWIDGDLEDPRKL